MFKAIARSLSLCSPRQRALLTLFAFGSLFLNFMDVVGILAIGLVASITIGNYDFADILIVGRLYGNENAVVWLLAIAMLLFLLKTIGGILLTRVRHRYLAGLEVSFSELIAESIFTNGLEAFNHQSPAQAEWAILRSTSIAFGTIIGQTLQLFAEATLALMIFVVFLLTDAFSAIAIVLYFAAVFALFHWSTRSRTESSGDQFASGSISVGEALSDLTAAYREITILGRIDYFLQRLSRARAGVAHSQASQMYMQAIPRLIVELALILGAILFATYQILLSGSDPDFGAVGIFLIGSLRMMSALLPLQRGYMQLRYEAPQADLAQSIMSRMIASGPRNSDSTLGATSFPMASTDNEGDLPSAPPGLEISFENVSFSYSDRGQETKALMEVSFQISAGMVAAFIGPSGSGKSSMADILLGLQEPDVGSVKLNGLAPSRLLTEFPGIAAYVPQKPGLVAGSLAANVAIGVPSCEIDEKRLWEVITRAQLEDFVIGLPEGLSSFLGEHLDGLSGGQVQRIGLARALYQKPRLLVLDEATSALDAETESSIIDQVISEGRDVTTVIIAHRLSTVRNADVVFLIDQGRIVDSGTLKELNRRSKLVRRYIDLMQI